jgi:putative membrane protein
VVWRLLKPANAAAWIGCAAGVAVMAAMALLKPGAADPSAGPQYALLFLAGLAGASAMILPGVSGGYLLLVMGQYIPILSAIDDLKQALLAPGGPDFELLIAAMKVVVPVGVGVVLGVVGVSNLIRWLLRRFDKATLGVLLGLLFGAVLGLWPFQQGVAPAAGSVVKGRVMTPELIAEVEPKDYPLETFPPSGAQAAMALGLIVAGFGVAQGVARIGRSES